MYFRPARTLFGLIAVGGAIAVGITTRDAGFTALTFVGGLALPRVLGFRRRGGPFGAGCRGGIAEHHKARFEGRMNDWHRQAHGTAEPPTTSAAGA